MTTANIISIIRMILIPVFIAFALLDFSGSSYIAVAIFIVASLTDWVDGYIARKYNQITTFGKFLDPLADKLLVIAAVLVLIERGSMGSIPAFIIIARELIVTSLRIVAMGEGIVIAAQRSGKWKTFIQMTGIVFLFTPFATFAPGAVSAGDVVVWLMAAITLISGIEYFKSFGGVLKPSAKNDTERK
ncbi:MAG: CDP-diacylglycerol--glycerol-3-phosphate 3-phosphatidyltransferase [Oscillospiraceae bacterium]|nr:CDP-diacylglycerol--glycerol-3-phosphate 3-phosphatidyltransferase [Oscillospiraceae bacterium]MBQ6902617.1 CDP-diacylglycerol--glycerol-3-phosphate 3-phosphatidyltransferase [Oscillospiraceae bacterium]